jgi:hypothetical protein
MKYCYLLSTGHIIVSTTEGKQHPDSEDIRVFSQCTIIDNNHNARFCKELTVYADDTIASWIQDDSE